MPVPPQHDEVANYVEDSRRKRRMSKMATDTRHKRLDSACSSKREVRLTSSGSRYIEDGSRHSKLGEKRRSAFSVDYNCSTRPGTNALTTEMSGTFNVTQNISLKQGPVGKLKPSTPH